ncbi:MAG: TetR/AcrR family transcriptional regulator [Ilumatobacter sp.]
MSSPVSAPRRGHARTALLDAAVQVVRTQGLHATTVDDLCVAAGVTKGAFFHHFASKEALAVAAAEHWSTTTGSLFDAAPYHDHADPVDRILAYVDFRAALIEGSAAEYTCLVGTMTQEAFATNPVVRDACAASILGHAATLEADFAQALARRPDLADVTAESLARYTQVVLQGAFVVGKATDDPAVVLDAISHLRRHLELLFPDHRRNRSDSVLDRGRNLSARADIIDHELPHERTCTNP